AVMQHGAAQQSEYVTLGLAALSGADERWLALAAKVGAGLYDFGGVRAFRARLRPARWVPIYLAHPAEQGAWRAIADSLIAFARGSLARFGVESSLRGPGLVLRLLAVGLLLWAIVLALAGPGWLPSPLVRGARVGLDIAVALGLFGLARRFRPRLA